jgi:ADP-heptose:LPS heptosyltransferase
LIKKTIAIIDRNNKLSPNQTKWEERWTFAKWTERSFLWEMIRLPRTFAKRHRLKKDPKEQIAIFHQGGIGSGLMMGPLLQMTRCQWPEASIDLLSQQPEDGEILKHVGLIDRYRVAKRGKFDNVRKYDLLLSAARSIHGDLLVRQVPAKVKIGFVHRVGWHERSALFHDLTIDPRLWRHECEQNIGLLETFMGKHLPPPPNTLVGLAKPSRERKAKKPLIFIHPGSGNGMSWKRWAPEKFAQVIKELFKKIDAEIGIICGPAEEAVVEEIERLLPHRPVRRFISRGSLLPLFEELSKMDCLVSNEGGMMHLASAAGVKNVAIFGPNDPDLCHPWMDPESFRIVRANIPCSPCYQPYSGLLKCTNPQHRQCLSAVLPESVVEAVLDVIGYRSSGTAI